MRPDFQICLLLHFGKDAGIFFALEYFFIRCRWELNIKFFWQLRKKSRTSLLFGSFIDQRISKETLALFLSHLAAQLVLFAPGSY